MLDFEIEAEEKEFLRIWLAMIWFTIWIWF